MLHVPAGPEYYVKIRIHDKLVYEVANQPKNKGKLLGRLSIAILLGLKIVVKQDDICKSLEGHFSEFSNAATEHTKGRVTARRT
jgi:hypothetical protein